MHDKPCLNSQEAARLTRAYDLAVRDFKETIRLIQIELGKKKASSDAIIDKCRMCETYYFLGQTLLLLNKFDDAKSALCTVLSFYASILNKSQAAWS